MVTAFLEAVRNSILFHCPGWKINFHNSIPDCYLDFSMCRVTHK